jgi:hypothetical protein
VGRRLPDSFLLDAVPPKPHPRLTGEHRLWWATLRCAARDLVSGRRSVALDALEFLRVTGEWLADSLFDIDPVVYEWELVTLVAYRNLREERPLESDLDNVTLSS